MGGGFTKHIAQQPLRPFEERGVFLRYRAVGLQSYDIALRRGRDKKKKKKKKNSGGRYLGEKI